LASDNFHLDETLVSPAGTPRVLNFPVVGVSSTIFRLATLAVSLPPVLNIARCLAGARSIADNDYGVIEIF